MNNLKKSFMSIVLLLAVIISWSAMPVNAQLSTTEAYKTSTNYMLQSAPNPKFGDEWFIIALARGGYNVPKNYYETYYKNVENHVKQVKGILHNRKYTEYSRVILALSAIGKDATNVGGYNLVEKLADFEQVKWQGLNGPIFALIALDSAKYELPSSATTNREKLISTIITSQLKNGGFSLTGDSADPDMTGMALQALAPYKQRADVQQVIEKSLKALANLQNDDGSYASWGNENVESVAQVLTALASLSIDPMNDERFNQIIANLLSFYSSTNGGFKHVKSEKTTNAMATEQAAYALAAYHRLQQGKSALYDMTDVKNHPSEGMLPPQLSIEKATFKDIEKHGNRSEIEQATELGLLKGYPDGTFRPNNQLTRVQAISILVRALKLESTKAAPYADITAYGQTTQDEIAAAYEAGIVAVSAGKLKPNEKLAREELALMLWKAYAHQTNQAYRSNKLAPLKDIQFLTKDSQQAITFLVDFEIASGSNGFFKPTQTTTRAQAAKMFVNFLKAVKQ